ncbi:EscU/YscU/HrcU family type III secretion system export apparatus switch protein [Candidatus Williamhamiltonella defendens]|uniref:EscU/YscU/HrcU family type III secretion system export apparatus switch protein n=2 Tax=Candidatus Williamhamiltonella defendens TaxID=138072 RepID=A0A2D3T9N9_9ENTR|nr:type III secretion system apparatus protein [Candidatus Hamiltonella defensa 5AT (Acyrthosiphon pisum)]ASV34031.1 EscU/YscU/HrcU family type III secretion system export apparatus switch protein [Candidatus Hamiltonella defensa]ATW30508.1 EscU/YscU/HrcU family type III secretion system export apparatus switch protein [Candidatus Hamiltonella defensa]ATW32517.1 EscU/YscU/HrcU family type III secretion system export apparatus switch protein [Candidatus Hamiltonella defensa]MBK4361720.1 EscU/Ysc
MPEKNEKPTEKRIKESREKGEVIKSVEITSGTQLAIILIYFSLVGPNLVNLMGLLITSSIKKLDKPIGIAVLDLTSEIASVFLQIMGVLGGGLALATILVVMSQVGPLLAIKAIGFKGQHINPISNFKNLVSLRSLFEICKSLFKVILVSLIFAYLLREYAPTFGYLSYCGTHCAFPIFGTLMQWLLGSLLACYVIFGILDYSFQHYNTMKKMKMSREEIKREYKDTDGDPEIKSKRRELQQEIQSGSLSNKVKGSTAVIKNPTHFAVCLFYHPEEAPLPIVLEKGKGTRAQTIIKLAEKFDVPVVENVRLAQMLHNEVNCDEIIPEHLFEPVAAILRFVLNLEYQADDEST